jgi:ATP-binding protein involved in chromosome partitioning
MPLQMYQPSEKKPLSQVKYVIAIAAGKGGVGKSTVTVNLGHALKKLGYSVGIMDTDIYGPSMRKMLPEDRLPIQRGQTIIPALCRGILMISMAYFRKEHEAAIVRAPIANGVITQFIQNVEWGELDFLLIDFPPGTGDVQLTLSQQANLTGAVMVTTPQDVAVMDVRKAMNMFEQVHIPILGIVENMSYYYHPASKETIYLFGKGGGEKLASEEGAAFLGSVPIEPQLSISGDNGKSLFYNETDEGGKKIVDVFCSIAKKVAAQARAINKPGEPSNKYELLNIKRADDHSFIIEWKDGVITRYRFNEVQKDCPCAGCSEIKEKQISPDVDAIRIIPVGRYALRIEFNSGCTAGIYSYDLLRKLGANERVNE